MNKKLNRLLLTLVLAGGVSAYADQQSVRFSDLPKAAQDTIATHKGDGQIKQIERKTENGRVVYEVELRREGKDMELWVGEDGALIKDRGSSVATRVDVNAGGDTRLEVDRNRSFGSKVNLFGDTVELSAAPPAVQRVVRENPALGQFKDIERKIEEGRTVYDLEFQREGPNVVLRVREDGTILSDSRNRENAAVTGRSPEDRKTDEARGVRVLHKRYLEMRDVPASVQKTITAQAGVNLKGIEIELERRGETPVYEVEFKRDGRDVHLDIGEDGTILRDSRNRQTAGYRGLDERRDNTRIEGPRMTVNDLPAQVRETLRTQGFNGQPKSIDRETENGRMVYKMEYERDGRNVVLHIAADGSIVKDNRKDTGAPGLSIEGKGQIDK